MKLKGLYNKERTKQNWDSYKNKFLCKFTLKNEKGIFWKFEC